MIEEIIDILNGSLTGLHRDEKLYGLAQSVIRKQGTEIELLPGLIDKTGEVQYVGIDDVSAFILYHKLNTLSTTAKNNGHGDKPGDLVSTYGLSMIIYWDRKRLNKMPDELLMLFHARLPQMITSIPNVKMTKIKTGNANFSSLQAYNQEYQGASFNLPPNVNLINLNYTIEMTFNPACLPTC
jgi:hypothetical protein